MLSTSYMFALAYSFFLLQLANIISKRKHHTIVKKCKVKKKESNNKKSIFVEFSRLRNCVKFLFLVNLFNSCILLLMNSYSILTFILFISFGFLSWSFFIFFLLPSLLTTCSYLLFFLLYRRPFKCNFQNA